MKGGVRLVEQWRFTVFCCMEGGVLLDEGRWLSVNILKRTDCACLRVVFVHGVKRGQSLYLVKDSGVYMMKGAFHVEMKILF